MATSALFILGAVLLSGLAALLFLIFSCVWLYKDSRRYGQEPVLWVLLAVFASPIIALLLYFIFGRKTVVDPCDACQAPVARSARYCQNCGADNPAFGQPAPKRSLGKLGVAAIGCGVVSVLLMVGVFVGMVTVSVAGSVFYDDQTQVQTIANLPIHGTIDLNSGWVTLCTESHTGGVWEFHMGKTSDGYHRSAKFTLDAPQTRILAADVSCTGETLELEVLQGDAVVYTETLSGADGVQYFALNQLQPGDVTLRITNRGATDISARLWVE